jgi:hypothetical protein
LPDGPGFVTKGLPKRIERDATVREGPGGRSGAGAYTQVAGRISSGGRAADLVSVPRMLAGCGDRSEGALAGSARPQGHGGSRRSERAAATGPEAPQGVEGFSRGVRVCQQWHDARTASEHLAPRPFFICSRQAGSEAGSVGLWPVGPRRQRQLMQYRVCKHLVPPAIHQALAWINHIWCADSPWPQRVNMSGANRHMYAR